MSIEQELSAVSPDRPAAGRQSSFTQALAAGFLPAFRHRQDGEIRLCRFPDGAMATVHLIDLLPTHWVRERDDDGRPSALVAAVEAGFLRGLEFWSLDDLIHPRLDS